MEEDGELQGGLIDDVRMLWQQLLGLAHDHLHLAVLETRLAGQSLVAMVAAGVMVALLVGQFMDRSARGRRSCLGGCRSFHQCSHFAGRGCQSIRCTVAVRVHSPQKPSPALARVAAQPTARHDRAEA